MSSRARLRALVPAVVLAVSVGFGAHAAAAAAEGAGYDGAGSGLRVRVVETAEAATTAPGPTEAPAGSPTTGQTSQGSGTGASGQTIEVRGSGFLANSAVTVRVAGSGAVRASANDVGSVVARLHLRSGVGGRVWITATGTDPSFQRRVVTDHLAVGRSGAPVAPTTLLLGAVGVCVVASAGVGVARQRTAAREAAA